MPKSVQHLEKLVHLDPVNFESDLMLGQFKIDTEVEGGLVTLKIYGRVLLWTI